MFFAFVLFSASEIESDNETDTAPTDDDDIVPSSSTPLPLPSSSDNNSNTIQRKLDSYNIDTIRPEDNDEDDASSSFPESIDPEIDIPIKFVDYEQVVGKIQRFIPFQGTPSSPKDNQDQQTPNRKQKRNAVESDVLMHKKVSNKVQSKKSRKKTNKESDNLERSYESEDKANVLPNFESVRAPEIYCDMLILRTVKELDFFQLYFTDQVISNIVKYTNSYAWKTIHNKKKYASADGSWKETNNDEIRRFIALLLYMGLVSVPTHDRYWSIKSLYHGLWAREIMSRLRFKALLAMLHVVDPNDEQEGDKLRKVRPFIEPFRNRCLELLQPYQQLAIDERLVKSKHRSGIRQYIKNKPVKFGIKLWVIADSKTGYTCEFCVYTGSGDDLVHKEHGLGYGVVMSLSSSFANQGYQMFFDNYYTSLPLVEDLFKIGIPSCGTVAENRKGFPDSMKGGKLWGKRKEKGDIRWQREGKTLCLQWKDNKVVTMLSTMDVGNRCVEVQRKVKNDGKFAVIHIKQPSCIERYNKFMNGVDKSDQLLSKYNILRKCLRWWKTLFFHLIDIAIVNGYILFQEYRRQNKDNPSLERPKSYALLDFRESVIRQLADLQNYANPPVSKQSFESDADKKYLTEHLPIFTKEKRN